MACEEATNLTGIESLPLQQRELGQHRQHQLQEQQQLQHSSPPPLLTADTEEMDDSASTAIEEAEAALAQGTTAHRQ
jgi:hypothetical protein